MLFRSTARGRYLSRNKFEKWLLEYGETKLGENLKKKFHPDIAFEPIKSITKIEEPIRTADVGICSGNRFIANGISVHNSLGCERKTKSAKSLRLNKAIN